MFDEYYKTQALVRLSQSSIGLPTTIGKVSAVKQEGFYVDVKLCTGDENLEPYLNIPTMRSKYYTYPIRENDFVILIPLSHLQNNFYELGSFGGEPPASYNSYVAIPVALLNEFLTGEGLTGNQDPEAFTNFFHLRTPELKTQCWINEEKINVNAQEVDWVTHIKNWNAVIEESWTNEIKKDYKTTVEGNSTLETKGNYERKTDGNEKIEIKGNLDQSVQGNATIECPSQLTLKSNTPITIQTTETLGALIAEGFNLIASSMTGPIPQAPSGISSGPTMADSGALAGVASRILQVIS